MRNIAAGNWKMNLNHAEASALLDELTKNSATFGNTEVVVAPPAIYLSEFSAKLKGHHGLKLAAQNVHQKPSGAYTGEISAGMLAALGISFCLVGHSERRQFFGETDESVAQKVNVLLENGISPIICVGEMLDERYADRHFEVVKTQVNAAIAGVTAAEKIIIAYEPVWAIGTGQTATTEQAQEMHAFIRQLLVEKFGNQANEVPILYGGSCNAQNAAELFAQQDVNGGLVGGASLKAPDFLTIIKSF